MPSDLLERMRNNPAGDWTIRDVESLCGEHELSTARVRIAMRSMPLPERDIDDPGSASDQAGLHS